LVDTRGEARIDPINHGFMESFTCFCRETLNGYAF